MKAITKRLLLIVASFCVSPLVHATLLGDTVDVTVASVFDTAISGAATVGAGVELTGSSLIYDYAIDLEEDSFTITVSKDVPAGNFTGIFESILIENIDSAIDSVVFNAAANSATQFNPSNSTIDWSTPGTIAIGYFPFASATPSSALSHAFTWDITFDNQIGINEPSVIALLFLGLTGLVITRR